MSATIPRTTFDGLTQEELDDLDFMIEELTNYDNLPLFEWNCWGCSETYSVDRVELAIDPSTPWFCQSCDR